MTEQTLIPPDDPALRPCPGCGAETLDADKFCGACGLGFEDVTQPDLRPAVQTTTGMPVVPHAFQTPPPVPPVAAGYAMAAVPRASGFKRQATIGDVLAALLLAAVLFASIATVAVVLIDDPGATGPQGVAGAQGAQGVRGERGARGNQGVRGKSGRAGVNGVNGSDGQNGRACSNDPDVPLPYC